MNQIEDLIQELKSKSQMYSQKWDNIPNSSQKTKDFLQKINIRDDLISFITRESQQDKKFQ